ncbi:MAG: permease, partial [Caldilineaceae bacterium]
MARWLRWTLTVLLILAALYAIFGDILRTGGGFLFASQRLQTFVTIFLGIFIEAAPFLLAGSLVSGFVSVFVDHSMIERLAPRGAIAGAFAGASLGLAFPVCECGVVP